MEKLLEINSVFLECTNRESFRFQGQRVSKTPQDILKLRKDILG